MKSQKDFNLTPVQEIWINEGDQIMAFMRGDLLYVFNFSPTRSYTDYGFLVPMGEYNVVLNTDSPDYGGFGFSDDSVAHFTNFDPMYAGDGKGWLQLYIPARSAVVLKKKVAAEGTKTKTKTKTATAAKKAPAAKKPAAKKAPAKKPAAKKTATKKK